MGAARLRVNRLTIEREAGRVRVDVELAHDDRMMLGRAETGEGVRGTVQAAAAATVSALNQFLPQPWHLRFDEAVLQSIAQRDAVIVQLRLRSEEVEERLVGSAVSDRIPEEAAVRAVLNAAERRTTPLLN
ncbi:MAG: hypothetical protein HY334_00215 [Armatimonadetes bacterium]|nr:hypothetical protein [Armatimonadota bacterium]